MAFSSLLEGTDTELITVVFGVGVGVGVMVVLAANGRNANELSLNLPVITAKKTVTTTSPRTKEMILFALSIMVILYHYKSFYANHLTFINKNRRMVLWI